MQQLRAAHGFELAEFRARWAAPEALTAYAKASPQLLQLREIERRRALLLDYDGAEEARRAADAAEAAETAAAHARIRDAMAAQLAQLQRRQRTEAEAAERLTERRLCHLRGERDAVLAPLERQLAKAERREALAPRAIAALSGRGRRCRSPRDDGDDVDLATPRTYAAIMRMRAATGARPLPVAAGGGGSARRSRSAQSKS
jgi:hypothetical protein